MVILICQLEACFFWTLSTSAAALAMEERDGHGPALSLVHRHVFGLKPDVKNNLHYAEDKSVVNNMFKIIFF